MRRFVKELDEMPRGYGIAWEDPARRVAVCYPVPLNRLVGWLRRIRWDLARPPRGPRAQAADVAHIADILERVADNPEGCEWLVLELNVARRLAVRLHEKLQRWEKTEDAPWRSWLRRAGGGWGMGR